SIIDFWRRWHMTLSRFFRDYLYIPLGGNRVTAWRRYANLTLVMLLAGLWHGAGWNFVAWGGAHAALVSINHGIRGWLPGRKPPAALGIVTTFFLVTLCWVLFRSPSLEHAGHFYLALLGHNGATLPAEVFSLLPWVQYLGLVSVPEMLLLGGGSQTGQAEEFMMLVLMGGLVFLAPAAHQMTWRLRLVAVSLSAGFVIHELLLPGPGQQFIYFVF
ncbi:MAG: MBOAT family O-acyltransferase, partial [Pseudomonadota bacterium]